MAKSDNQLWTSAREYFTHFGKLGWAFFVGGVGGSVGTLNNILQDDVILPAWAWLMLAISCFLFASFVAFHRVRMERDKKGKLPKIRHKIRDHLDWFTGVLERPPHVDWEWEKAGLDIEKRIRAAHADITEHNTEWACFFFDLESLNQIEWNIHSPGTRALRRCVERLEDLLKWE